MEHRSLYGYVMFVFTLTTIANDQSLRLSCLAIFGIFFFVAVSTFNGYAGMSYSNTTGLFVTYLVFPLVCVVIYAVSQLILVVRTLDDRWVIGDLLFGVGFYAVGVILLFAFSVRICDAVRK